jgi:S-DNA-T family DNA segregation ATPase FtsK/SpoIIIE
MSLRTAPPTRAPIPMLPRRRSAWPGRCAASVAAGLAAFGGATLTGYEQAAGPGLTAGVAGAVASGLLWARELHRDEILDRIVVAAAQLQGYPRPVRASVKVLRWSKVTGGLPTRVAIDYSPTVDDGPDLRGKLKKVLEQRTGLTFEISKHNQRRCRITFRSVAPVVEPAEVKRSRELLQDLFGESATIQFAYEGDQVNRMRVEHKLKAKAARQQVRKGIENSLTALLDGRWRAKWELTKDEVTFERRPVMPTAVPHKPAPITDENRWRIPVAVDEDGNLVVWNLKGSGPHMLITGKTGTGKTVAINGAIMEIARRGWPVWICDPKRIEFMGLRDWPNVEMVSTTVAEMIATIKLAHDEMERRYEAIENEVATEDDFEPLVLVLDEYRNFFRQVNSWYSEAKAGIKGLPTKCPVFEWVAAIAEKGRSGHVHIILGTQRPDADFLTGSMRDNFDTRFSLGRLSPEGAKMMWESYYLGVSVPRKIRGRGTGLTEDERVEEVQVLWTPDPRRTNHNDNKSDQKLLDNLRPANTNHPPKQIELGDDVDLDGHDISEWFQVMDATLVPAKPRARRPALPGLPSLHGVQRSAGEQDAPPASAEHHDHHEPPEFDPFDGYLEAAPAAVSRVEIGDLLCIDDQLGLWAAVEGIEELDEDEDGYVSIAWRDDDGADGTLSLPSDDVVEVRRPEPEPDNELVGATA